MVYLKKRDLYNTMQCIALQTLEELDTEIESKYHCLVKRSLQHDAELEAHRITNFFKFVFITYMDMVYVHEVKVEVAVCIFCNFDYFQNNFLAVLLL